MDGFKEWDVVCHALECGWQSLVLRAGGIHDTAKWQEELPSRFFLMPNDYHAALDLVRRIPAGAELPVLRWQIRSWAEVIEVRRIDEQQILEQLEPLHILKRELWEKRFYQNEPAGLWLILLRVHLLPKVWTIADQPEFGGCRSLVELPPAPFSLQESFVLEEQEFLRQQVQLKKILGGGSWA